MTPRKHGSETLPDVLVEGEDVDYESDTNFESEQDSITCISVRRGDIPAPPTPFSERGAADADTPLCETPAIVPEVITNKLDEQQQLRVEAGECARLSYTTIASDETRRDYGYQLLRVDERIRQVTGQSLAGWVTGPEAMTPVDIALRDALHEKYLTLQVTTTQEYLARLDAQARGASVPSMRTIPIVLFLGETDVDEDEHFIRWVHRTHHLRDVRSLPASSDVADIRLERKLRYEFAKFRAKRHSRFLKRHQSAELAHAGQPSSAMAAVAATGPCHTMDKDPSAPTSIGGKCPGSRVDPERYAGKRRRRRGNLSGGVLRIPKSFRIQGIRATSPDTGIGCDDDVALGAFPHGNKGSLAHREAQVEAVVSAASHAELR
uniref:Uncharacterized protein AlNc14C638G12317 n=1 Tax=Albugo laibachii Nc14 TaxID=890382 RepID=F0X1K9_9STRA|nr:conserved hypothetical protein [Albugo laibachii Nc14]|eukprot:CCA27704.1 conserved hypothetical protein [Albugo laibachii Nc14]